MDEVESDNPKYAEIIDQNLKILRESTSGDEMATLHGTSSGEGRQWNTITMALLSSIGAAIRHGADMDRFTVLTIRRRSADQDHFVALKKIVEILTPVWCESYHARTYALLPELFRCIDVFIKQASILFGSSRAGDQVGTICAGSWIATHDKAATAAEAKAWLKKNDILSLSSGKDDKTDEELLLDEILSSSIEVSDGHIRSKVSIGNALIYWFAHNGELIESESIPGATADNVRIALEETGIKPVRYSGSWLHVANNHSVMRRRLKDTAWRETYTDLLRRLPFYDDSSPGSTSTFAGVRKRYVKLNAKDIIDHVPF